MTPIGKRISKALEQCRDNLRDAVKRAILAEYVVDEADASDRGRFAVRRHEVYRSTARAMRIRLVTPPFCTEVKAAAVELGAIAVRTGGRALFRGMYRREICPAQAGEEATSLRRNATGGRGSHGGDGGGKETWASILEAEGMPEELSAVRLVDQRAAVLNTARIAKATDAFWRLDREHAALRFYMEGLSIREIEGRTGLKRHALHRILHRHGLTGTEGQDV